jgi:hypothetical protein
LGKKKVILQFENGKGHFITGGTELVKKLPFTLAELHIQGPGFKIICTLTSLNTETGEFNVVSQIEYEESIK